MKSLLALISFVALASCVGAIDEQSSSDGAGGHAKRSGDSGSDVTEDMSAPVADGWPAFTQSKSFQLRRLTSEEYAASVKTLLGVSIDGMPAIEPVSPVAGFPAIGASTASVSNAGVGQFEDAARFLAEAVFASDESRTKIVPCTPSGAGDTACFESFATAFGLHAFRRPLTTDEIKSYAALTSSVATATGDVWQGLEATASAFLQSPNFLYLAEVGEPDPGQSDRYRFTGYEMASRLAYFLTNNTPDDDLLTAAAAGSLVTPDGIQTQVERLLALPSAHDAVGAFFTTLLSLQGLDTLSRPVEVFPSFSPTIGPSMKQETLRVLDDLIFDRDGDYRQLFDQKETFVNAELAALYGVPAPAGGGFERVTLPESSGRVGLLGQAGVLAARDHSDGTSPTKRGLFILTRLLCQDLPLLPPANLAIPPAPTGLMTARDRLEQHVSDKVCASCHSEMDPVGLSLEHFDAMGEYRDTDRGMSIDDTGVIDGIEYQGEPGLGALLRDHPALGPCLIQAYYGVSVGHLATDFDHDTFASMVDEFDTSGGRVRSLLTAITLSDGFRYLPAPN